MITLVNATENNLKSVTLNIPSNKLIVVTGVSGSGKSTLVYDVIFKEARRRYIESFSANARQFIGQLHQPSVQFISGLMPAIALQQNHTIISPRSTVGTLTELYDLLRLLYARTGISEKHIDINRRLFSFNSPKGACKSCKGLGVEDWIDSELLIADENKTIRDGAFAMTTPSGYIVYSQVTMNVLNEVCLSEGFSVDIPWKNLSADQKKIVLFGSSKLKVPFGKHPLESRMKWSGITAKPREEDYYKGIIPVMEEILKRDRNPNVLRFARTKSCSTCHGSRLNTDALSVIFAKKNIAELADLTITELIVFLEGELKSDIHKSSKIIIAEILKTAKVVEKLGLGFLTLKRSSESLSGGETQRLRLAKLVTTEMRGILYVFDEPSVGLHAQEIKNLLEVLYHLKNNGNTVMLVEHNEQIMQNAEWIIDLGPEAGINGGNILFNGATKDFLALKDGGLSKTLLHLRNEMPFKTNIPNHENYLSITGASVNNLKNINAKFKLNALNVVTGLSGAGKSSLVDKTLAQYFAKNFNHSKEIPGQFKSITGDVTIQQLQVIDQKPIGKTPRSNPATYTGLSDEMRNLFAKQVQAKLLNFDKKHFSFNTKGGRCEKCEGAGYEQIGMQMLGTVEVLCSQCNGKQFKNAVLDVKYQEKTIAEIYNFTIDEAFDFFNEEPKIQKYLAALKNVGLGYLKLNQRSSTLSGGEARRVKLAKGLVKIPKKHTLYIIDEPSSGLHAHDVQIMLANLEKLINLGHTVVLVEQNHTFIKNADHLIELGPVSGGKGGKIIFHGIPKDILNVLESNTTKALLGKIETDVKQESHVFDIYNPIQLKGVTTHNLKNIDVEIPVNKITTITGVSGSGKSSLAFDTLFTEGRQRYAESFSAYMRNRLNINSEARFKSVKGLMPTIAVNQQSVSQNERSTVGTMTDIYDYLRLLYARVGKNEVSDQKLSASHFSFNHEQGACTRCQGLGYQLIADAEKLVSNPDLSLLNGAMNASKPGKFYGDIYGQYIAILKTVGEKHQIDFTKPWNKLTPKEQNIAMQGTGDETYKVNWDFQRKNRTGTHQFEGHWPGFLYHVNEEYLRKSQDKRKDALLPIMTTVECSGCNGSRLNSVALQYNVLDLTIHEMVQFPVIKLLQEFRKQVVVPNAFNTEKVEQRAAQIICVSIINGLDILDKLGLGYLILSRQAKTLSGGEGQRVRLAAGLAQDISGVCFVLDEPTTGLHPKDLDNLYFMLHELKRQGNTVAVCEHDPGFIRYSDHVIELGPEGGKNGGQIIDQGEVNHIIKSKNSIVGKYLKPDYLFKRHKRLADFKNSIKIQNAFANNLKNITIKIPTKSLVVVSGVSGSGKSSLVKHVIYNSHNAKKPQNCDSITGFRQFNQVVLADQKVPKGNALSFVASYLDIFNPIKEAFIAEAINTKNNLTKAHFSLAGKEGKCPTCLGKGFIKTSMDFLSDVFETCEECHGNRFNTEVLNTKINTLNVADVLNMPITQLISFLDHKKAIETCKVFLQFGLGYLSAGQTLNTLSGGELQRLKLAKTLLESKGKPTLFLLDEPTTGLHMKDVELLMTTFDQVLDKGHSLIVVEHHKTVIDNADYLIEMGPGAGEEGGHVV
jgi:excinuclease ABC subunit A